MLHSKLTKDKKTHDNLNSHRKSICQNPTSNPDFKKKPLKRTNRRELLQSEKSHPHTHTHTHEAQRLTLLSAWRGRSVFHHKARSQALGWKCQHCAECQGHLVPQRACPTRDGQGQAPVLAKEGANTGVGVWV